MADLPFPDIPSSVPQVVSPSVPLTPLTTPSVPIIPNLGIENTPLTVPTVLDKLPGQKQSFQPVAEWEYKRFKLSDIFYSKLGIATITSLSSFAILSTINPPFVQEHSDNPIEINRPSFTILYSISLVVFIIMMVVPVSK